MNVSLVRMGPLAVRFAEAFRTSASQASIGSFPADGGSVLLAALTVINAPHMAHRYAFDLLPEPPAGLLNRRDPDPVHTLPTDVYPSLFAFLRDVITDCIERIRVEFRDQRAISRVTGRVYKAFSVKCSHITHHGERAEAAKDTVSDLYLSLKSACESTGIQDFDHYLTTCLFNAVGKRCQQAARAVRSDSAITDAGEDHRMEELSEGDFERILRLATSWLKDQRNHLLLRMYVDGHTNADMRAVDGRSDRTITRLRSEVFPEVLRRAYLHITA